MLSQEPHEQRVFLLLQLQLLLPIAAYEQLRMTRAHVETFADYLQLPFSRNLQTKLEHKSRFEDNVEQVTTTQSFTHPSAAARAGPSFWPSAG